VLTSTLKAKKEKGEEKEEIEQSLLQSKTLKDAF
jgi:hypothetical protein